MSVRIVHGLAMERSSVLDRMLAARGHWPVVSVAIVKVVIHMPHKVLRAVEPGASADEHAAGEPLRTVVPVRRAVVRRNLIIAVRTNRRLTDADRDLCG